MKHTLSIIAFITFFGILLSITHNIGYFLLIDLGLLSIFSLEDHVSSGIAFLPITVVYFTYLALLGISSRVKEDKKKNKKKLIPSKVTSALFKVAFILYAIIYFFFIPVVGGALFIFIGVFLYFIEDVIDVLERNSEFFLINCDHRMRALVKICLFLLFFIFVLGLSEGNNDLNFRNNFEHTIIIKNTEKNVQILRFFKNGFLANTEDGLVLIRNKSIVKIKKADYNNKSLSCRILRYCPEFKLKLFQNHPDAHLDRKHD